MRALEWMKGLALTAVMVAGAGAFVLEMQLSTLLRDADVVVKQAPTSAQQVADTLAERIAQLQKPIDDLDAQVNAIGSSASGMASKADARLDDLHTVIAALQPPIAESAKAVHDARLTLDNVNKAAIDERLYFEQDLPPLMSDLRRTAANVQTATADLDPLFKASTETATHFSAITADAQLKADAWAHPSKKKIGFWGGVEAGGDVARHFMPPIF